MTMFPRVGEKRRIDDIGIEDEEAIGSLCRLGGRPVSPKSAMEQEKRIRREIANSNERRRMQSINAGFASLKTLLPHHEGEKLSKAAILQQTAEYIYQLEQEKTRLLSQNCQLKRLVNQQQHHADNEGGSGGDSPSRSPSNDTHGQTNVESGDDLRREMIDLRVQLDRERRHRLSLEEHIRTLETAAYGPLVDTPLPEVTRHVNIQVPQKYHKAETTEIKSEPEIKVKQERQQQEQLVQQQQQHQQQQQQQHHGHQRAVANHIPPPPTQQLQQKPSQPSGQKVAVVAAPPPPQQPAQVVKPVSQIPQPLVVGQVTNVVEVKTTPRLLSTINNAPVKTEHINAVQHPHHPHTAAVHAHHHHPTTTLVAAQPVNPPMIRQQQPPTLITRPNTIPVTSVATHHSVATSGQVTPATTIVMSAGSGMDALPSVLKALTSSGRVGPKVEVEPAPRVPSPAATIEYVGETNEANKSHTVYIVNSTNTSCQKSLDTICEAIRHLEGDHMFQTNEEQHPHIEEEIITEETLTIEDHSGYQMSIVDQPEQPMNVEGEQESLTLHMVEPQDAPLELTTTHRASNSEQQRTTFSPKSVSSSPKCSSTSLPSSTNQVQPTRPGVIVVKHP